MTMSEQMTYVCYGACGHVNAFVGVPPLDDKEERGTLLEWLQFYIETGHIEYVGLEALKSVKLDCCNCAALDTASDVAQCREQAAALAARLAK